MRWLAVAALPVLMVLTQLSHAGLRERREAFPADQDVLYLPPPRHLRTMSCGYREALADLVWIRAVIFAGDRIGSANTDWIAQYLRAIFELAPSFRRPYAWGGTAVIYSGQAPTKSSIEDSIDIYRSGLEHFPEDHELLFPLGMLLTREVQNMQEYSPEEREAANREGRLLLQKAASFGAPPLVRQLAATYIDEGASNQMAIQFLEAQLLQAEDAGYRRMLRRKLSALAGEAALSSMESTRERFAAEHRENFPYIPPDLYNLIQVSPTESTPRPSVQSAAE